MHPIAAEQMDPYRAQMPLRWSAFDPGPVDAARAAGYVVDSDEMLERAPRSRRRHIDAFHAQGAIPTGTIDEGDAGDQAAWSCPSVISSTRSQ